MEEKIKLPRVFILASLAMVVVGIAALAIAFAGDPQRGWANFLLNNVYFVSLSAGALLFFSIQRVTHSGWSAGFLRVPEAMAAFLPVAAILFLLMIPGAQHLYHWSHADAVSHDPLLAHKAPYLNTPFWIARMVLYFALWILMFLIIRRISLKEDVVGGLEPFRKLEHRSKVFIFIIIITFSFAMIDWVMSIDAHWYSTIFAIKNFVAAFHHAAIVITLIVLLMMNWTLAAFGEEFAYRIVLMRGFSFIFGDTRMAMVSAVLIQAVLFGLIHAYQGPAGIAGSTISGLVFGIVTVAARGINQPPASPPCKLRAEPDQIACQD